MKLLVIGAGGREHAIAWKLAQSPRIQKVYVAPGNAGTALEPGVENLPITDFAELISFVENENIAFTVVGPEAPLAAGVVDAFRVRGLKIFGPTRKAAQLESSKDFAKQFMVKHDIPTAHYQTFTDAAAARAYVDEKGAPIVIKADGLAAGKGVVVAMTLTEAHAAIGAMLPGDDGGRSRVVIEEFLAGEEASFIVMCDGQTALPLATSQDHKRLLDGDAGPNTGGMGAYSPAPVVTPEIHARVMREVIQPVLTGMALDGLPYTGFLYAGLMISQDGGIKVLEFNCRMGDPETQPIMMRLKTDLVDLMEAALETRLSETSTDWDRRVALGVVMAAAGYPDAPRKGDEIVGLAPAAADSHVFHAGTALRDGKVVTHGGRVLCVTALGDTVKQAQRSAYALCDTLRFDGAQFRRDIGHRAVRR
ncbi:phosphoribosylamine--glycine ligase [Methyloversatilis thermotolerans]|uniref:phosphoribosylamine--glycine ligase n=1 Tax=Methyloversatilis thermotolerans TaxID=1346290 RepID=UPI00036C44EA|nr:phosphoribosylamine--glycine ligase [Methyloversatilis thermotolerans]